MLLILLNTCICHALRAALELAGKVKQGQLIGYVGSTGLASGPHLCYRFWKNGKQVDAMKVDLPASEPITEDYLSNFNRYKGFVKAKLDEIPYPVSEEEVLMAGMQKKMNPVLYLLASSKER